MDIPNYDPNEIRMSETETQCPHSDTKMGEPGNNADCTHDGYEAQIVCSKCGAEIKPRTKVQDKLGHQEKIEGAVSPTCTTDGQTGRKVCTRPGCNQVLSENQVIPKLGHNMVNGKCTRCPYESTGGIVDGSAQDAPEEGATNIETASTETGATEAVSTEATQGTDTGLDRQDETGVESLPTEEAVATTLATDPGDEVDSHGLFGCNPFTCGCWIYLLLALVIGVVLGFILGSAGKKKKKAKRRQRDRMFTEVDYAIPAPVADPTMQSNAMGVTAAVHHHVGARKDQQDSYGVSDLNAYATNGILAIVADGMGGLANGKAVSSNLVHGMLNYFRQTSGQESVPDMMLDMLTQSNDQINRMLQGADRSGSILVSAIIRGGYLHFLTVGDSRIYLYRHGILLQLNREHIYQEELAVKAVNHIVPLAQVTGDRQAHALTSYLGIGRLTHLDRNYEGIKLEPGDKLLLASDGVFGTLSQEEMEEALRNGIGDATDIIGEKIRKANMQYQDNNTALVLEYHG